MSEHIVTGTTEEEREKEIYEYAIKCGWDDSDARLYAITYFAENAPNRL